MWAYVRDDVKSVYQMYSMFYRLRDNLVTDKGAELLMSALAENTTLQYLWYEPLWMYGMQISHTILYSGCFNVIILLQDVRQ